MDFKTAITFFSINISYCSFVIFREEEKNTDINEMQDTA